MRGHAPPCRLLGRSACKLRLPSIHRTAERDCLKSPFRLQTKALRVNNGRGVAPERTPPISSYKTLRASLPDGQSYPDRTGTGRAFSSHKRDKTSTRTKQRRCATRPYAPSPLPDTVSAYITERSLLPFSPPPRRKGEVFVSGLLSGSHPEGRRKGLRRSGRCAHQHVGPLVAEQVEGGREVRCLVCGTVGPARKTSEEARRALQDITASR